MVSTKIEIPAVIIILVVIYIISAISIAITHATQQYEELIIIYPQGYDIQSIESFGCVIERIFTRFNMALLTCSVAARRIIEGLGIKVVQNFNVSIDVTTSNLRIYKEVKQVWVGEHGIPLAWSWAISRVAADIVWRHLGVTGYGATIAILDTGIDPTHPLLAGKLRGWIEFDRKGRPVCSSPRDTYGHGTWVASIAAGGDTNTYIFGVAPYANIISALVLPGGYGTAAQVLAGLEWSLEPYDCRGVKLGIKPDVVSMSFGATANYSNVFLQAIAKLIENGIVPVAAIGNSGPHTTSNPGNIWGVIGVGATNFDNNVAWFSSYEDVEWPDPPSTWPFRGTYQRVYRKPDLVAPGIDVPGAFPGELLAIGSGTSASTPIVAGIAAMVSRILASKGFNGVKLVEEVYSIITSTATPIDTPGSGNGLVNAFRAISKALGRTINNIEVKVEPSTVTLWEEINVSVRGVMEGIEIAVYMAGVEVYRGIYRVDRPITVRVPPTHIGGNEVIVVDRGGLYYGETIASVLPSIYVTPSNVTIGRFITITVSGLGIGDLITIYMRNNILTLDIANLRGSYIGSLAIPHVPPGRYNIVLNDFSTPSIRLYTTIDVVDRERETITQIINRTEVYNYTTIVKEYMVLPITVNIKHHYIFNTTDYIDVMTVYPNITIRSIEAKSLHNRRISCNVVNITEIFNGVHRVWFIINMLEPIEEEDIILKLEISLGNINIDYPVPIKLLAIDPIRESLEGLKARIGDLNGSLLLMDTKMLNMSNTIIELVKDLDEAKNRIEKLYIEVNSIRGNLTSYSPIVDYVAKRLMDIEDNVNFVERLIYIVLAIAITLIVVSTIFMRRISKG